ncbi:MAG: SDR family oxidoreductase [Sphingobacteriales bacterium]|nr:MAG: SDR family oxidoreductase [Sphingobacteriales bacterium]
MMKAELPNSMQGKTVVITGANSGIGKAACMALAKQGAQIVMVCRNQEKGELARKDIIACSSNQQIDLFICDLASQQQIRRLAVELTTKFDRIDVLINNAGILMPDRQLSEDVIELTFATNHLAYFLLTRLLLKTLNNTPFSRIINMASGAHQIIRQVDFDNLQGEKSYNQWQAYGLSKLANILFTYELSRRQPQYGATVNCMHPGVVSTNFGQKKFNAGWIKLGFKILKPFIRTAEQGAETCVFLASSSEVKGISGKYFDTCKAVRSSAISYEPHIATRFWEISEQLTGLNQPEPLFTRKLQQ